MVVTLVPSSMQHRAHVACQGHWRDMEKMSDGKAGKGRLLFSGPGALPLRHEPNRIMTNGAFRDWHTADRRHLSLYVGLRAPFWIGGVRPAMVIQKFEHLRFYKTVPVHLSISASLSA